MIHQIIYFYLLNHQLTHSPPHKHYFIFHQGVCAAWIEVPRVQNTSLSKWPTDPLTCPAKNGVHSNHQLPGGEEEGDQARLRRGGTHQCPLHFCWGGPGSCGYNVSGEKNVTEKALVLWIYILFTCRDAANTLAGLFFNECNAVCCTLFMLS